MKLSTEQDVVGKLPLSCGLTKQQAEQIYEQGKEAVVFALLQLAKMAAEQSPTNLAKAIADDPSTPSSQKPVFVKPNEDKKRRKEPGRKKGHIGSRRQLPQRIGRTIEHIAECCPDCGGELNRRSVKRKRIIEDIPETASVETVEHIIHRDFCPRCDKIVEPVISEALPKSSIGNAILVLSAWLHYALGNTISQILAVFNFHLLFKMTAGGLVQMWHRLSDIFFAWYEEISENIQQAGVLHGDETGWRVNGKTHWLWCFTSKTATIFTIERSRAGPVVLKFIKECFDGVLVKRGLPRFLVPVVMRVYRTYSPCLEEGGA